MEPEAFNRVEEGTVTRQPHHIQSLGKQTQGRCRRLAAVIGGIVHHDDNFHIGIDFQHQILDELDETITVFACTARGFLDTSIRE